MAWFNRLSPDGSRIVGQRISPTPVPGESYNEIELDGAIIGHGHAPQWLTPDVVLWAQDGGTHLFRSQGAALDIGRETNGLQANGRGDYVAEHRSPPYGYTHNGTFVASQVTPKLWPDGSLTFDSLVWTRTVVAVPDSVPWVVEQQPWMSATGDTRLVAHPEGSLEGYVVAVGPTYHPDAAWWVDAKRLRIVWTDSRGRTQEAAYRLTEPRQSLDLTPPPPPPPPTGLKPPKVNVVSYASRLEPNTPEVIVEWQDTANKQVCRVWISDQGSLHVSHRNMAGEDTTGKHRPIEIVCPASPDPIPPPPETDPREWKGNFLANGLEPWAFMYPGWDEGRRARFRGHYRRLGMTHLPIGIWGKYADEPTFDYRNNQLGYRGILQELLADGIIACPMVITDETEGWKSADESIHWARNWLPGIADLVSVACLGWELNQVRGWNEKGPDGNPRQGHDMIRLAQAMEAALYIDTHIYLHLQPDWWGPHYTDGHEAEWWRDVDTACDGLLMNVQPTAPIPQVMHYCYTLPSPHGWPPGICGRLEGLGKDFVLFEHSRDVSRWSEIVKSIPGDRGHGFC